MTSLTKVIVMLGADSRGLRDRRSHERSGPPILPMTSPEGPRGRLEHNIWHHCKILNYSGSLFFCERISFFPLGHSTRRNSSNASLSQVVAFARTILTRGGVNGAGLVNWC